MIWNPATRAHGRSGHHGPEQPFGARPHFTLVSISWLEGNAQRREVIHMPNRRRRLHAAVTNNMCAGSQNCTQRQRPTTRVPRPLASGRPFKDSCPMLAVPNRRYSYIKSVACGRKSSPNNQSSHLTLGTLTTACSGIVFKIYYSPRRQQSTNVNMDGGAHDKI